MTKCTLAAVIAAGSLAGASVAQAEPVSLTPDQADDVVAGLTLFLGGIGLGGAGGTGFGGGASASGSSTNSTCSGTCTFNSANLSESFGGGAGSGGSGGSGFGGLFLDIDLLAAP